jgi:hypothetical protein
LLQGGTPLEEEKQTLLNYLGAGGFAKFLKTRRAVVDAGEGETVEALFYPTETVLIKGDCLGDDVKVEVVKKEKEA